MLLRAILTAAAVGFAVSVGHYLPTLLIGAGRMTTITTEAVALASGGDRRVIGVYAFLQTGAAGARLRWLPRPSRHLLFRNRRAMRRLNRGRRRRRTTALFLDECDDLARPARCSSR